MWRICVVLLSVGLLAGCASSGRSEQVVVLRENVVDLRERMNELQEQVAELTAHREVAACRLLNRTGGDRTNSGFPINPERIPASGNVNVAVLFVDFPDAPTPRYPGPAEIFKNSIPDAEKYLEAMSYGTLDLTFRPLLKWLRMPQSVSLLYSDLDLGMSKTDFGMDITRFALVDGAISLADPEFDFEDIDSVVVIATPEADSIKRGWAQQSPDWHFYADGQTIGNSISLGSGSLVPGGRSDWVSGLIAHELGHNLGLPDLYDANVEKDSEGNLPYEEVLGFVGAFGIMGGYGEFSNNEMFAWSRWRLGWLRDTQVACITSFPASVWLTPLAIPGGRKAVVVPLTETTAVVVESRRKLGYDSDLRKEGALVYKVDTSVPSGEGPIVVGSLFGSPPDSSVILGPGGVWNWEGYFVTVKEVTPEGDLVEITAQ